MILKAESSQWSFLSFFLSVVILQILVNFLNDCNTEPKNGMVISSNIVPVYKKVVKVLLSLVI